MYGANGGDFSGQRPNQTDPFSDGAWNEIIVQVILQVGFSYSIPVHVDKVPFESKKDNCLLLRTFYSIALFTE